jgi:hypothetical protein
MDNPVFKNFGADAKRHNVRKATPARSSSHRGRDVALVVLFFLGLAGILSPGRFSQKSGEKTGQLHPVTKASAVQPSGKPVYWREVALLFKELEKAKRETLEAIMEKMPGRPPAKPTPKK